MVATKKGGRVENLLRDGLVFYLDTLSTRLDHGPLALRQGLAECDAYASDLAAAGGVLVVGEEAREWLFNRCRHDLAEALELDRPKLGLLAYATLADLVAKIEELLEEVKHGA